MTRTIWNTRSCFVVGILFVSATGCGPTTYDSPEAVFEGLKNNVEDGNCEAVAQCLTVDSQRFLAGALMIRIAHAFADDAAKKEEVQALLKKHDLGAEFTLSTNSAHQFEKILNDDGDHVALVADLADLLQKSGEDFVLPKWQARGELSDVKIDGDKAIGRAFTSEENVEALFMFEKIDGGWRMGFFPLVKPSSL